MSAYSLLFFKSFAFYCSIDLRWIETAKNAKHYCLFSDLGSNFSFFCHKSWLTDPRIWNQIWILQICAFGFYLGCSTSVVEWGTVFMEVCTDTGRVIDSSLLKAADTNPVLSTEVSTWLAYWHSWWTYCICLSLNFVSVLPSIKCICLPF